MVVGYIPPPVLLLVVVVLLLLVLLFLLFLLLLLLATTTFWDNQTHTQCLPHNVIPLKNPSRGILAVSFSVTRISLGKPYWADNSPYMMVGKLKDPKRGIFSLRIRLPPTNIDSAKGCISISVQGMVIPNFNRTPHIWAFIRLVSSSDGHVHHLLHSHDPSTSSYFSPWMIILRQY